MEETQEMTEEQQGTIENVELYSAVCYGHVLEMIHVIQKYRHVGKKAWKDFVEIAMDHDNPTDVFRRSSRLAKKDLKELLQRLGVVFQATRVPLHKALTHCPFANETPALDRTALNDFLREQSARSSKETPSKETGEESNENHVDDDLGNANEKQEESDERADEREKVEDQQDAPEEEDAEKSSTISGNPPDGDDGDGDDSDDVIRRKSSRRASSRKDYVGTDERDSGYAPSTFINMFQNINDRYSGNADENFMGYETQFYLNMAASNVKSEDAAKVIHKTLRENAWSSYVLRFKQERETRGISAEPWKNSPISSKTKPQRTARTIHFTQNRLLHSVGKTLKTSHGSRLCAIILFKNARWAVTAR
jgi:hypothetical protein